MSACCSLAGFTRDELMDFVADQGLPAYRAAQIWKWVYGSHVFSWPDMTNLPSDLREHLADEIDVIPVEKTSISSEASGTVKLVVRLRDGHLVEEVLIPDRDRRTVCVSSQVGCSRHCVFCASGRNGLVRDLTAGEIVGQVLLACRELGDRPSNVVYMGIGEPMDNYDNVIKSVRIINDAEGLCVGARKITISTCGIVPGIRRLAGEGIQVELSVSLHAANDALRSRLMPAAREYPLDTLVPACREYAEKTGRMITFEYTLIDGVNDRQADAEQVVLLCRGFNSRVNLIPMSPVEGAGWKSSSSETARRFSEVLEAGGINCTLRLSKGASLKAACGQLTPGFAVSG